MPNQTSSSLACQWSYDVFLSFRGQDTRTGFTGNLYHALRKKGVNIFMDDKELRKGEEIREGLMKAIKESRMGIVVFSENYASSTFCLRELVKIMEWIKEEGRVVMPVFYKVEPSEVRHQRGRYGEALEKHETRISDKDELQNWRLALQEAASLSGWHFTQGGYEYEFIGDIIQEVIKRINRSPLYVAEYPVGLESRVQKVKSLLDVESNDGVHMVGIYGIGGIGKTTLASAVSNSIADQFEGLSFLSDIRENTVKHGLVHLQETLLSDILGVKDIKLGSVRKGIPIIKSRLCKKKILLILDDVDKKKQLEVLAGGLDWFGSGSRIIITTRDTHLLSVHGVERTYEVEGLNHEEALELFSRNAFKRNEVNPSYLDISERLILRANGLPLSLEIIGSDLYGKTELEWKSALDAYQRIPHEDIQEILRVSYDGLQDFEKEIFLDTACFFKGYLLGDFENIIRSGRGNGSDYAIGVLVDKCLIKIDKIDKIDDERCVRMHDLIQDMGREIVRQESPFKPGDRSRLWFSKDILHVFKENKGSDKTEIIMLHLPRDKDKDVQWDGNALKKMENLKILVVKNARFSRAPTALPKSLSVLKWCGYPEPSLPADFDPKKLVILDLSQSSFTFKNQLNMKFMSLTEMNLSGCQVLKEVPDLSGAPSLKKLQLDECKNLVEVHDSVGFLYKLEHLSFNCCTNLSVLPHGFELTSLKTMSLVYCTSLRSFPKILGKMENIQLLDLGNSSISCLPFSAGSFLGFESFSYLRQSSYPSPFDFQHKNSSCGRNASFECCNLADKFLAAVIPLLCNVKHLCLDYSNITIIPSSISVCLSLKKLSLNECKELREIRGLPPNVEDLSAVNCTSLTLESKEMLLSKTLHENGGRNFKFPGSAIPSWLNYSTKAPSLRFWFRNKFPAFTLCVVGVCARILECKMDPILTSMVRVPFTTVIESSDISIQTNHTILCDLWIELGSEKLERFLTEDKWYSAEISFKEKRGITEIEWMGVHAQERRTKMADIQFTEPQFNMADNQFWFHFKTYIRNALYVCPHTGLLTGDFEFWDQLCAVRLSVFGWVSELHIPEKIRLLLRLILSDCLPTNYECHRRNLIKTAGCESCSESREDILHCLRDCPHAREVWIRMGFLSLPRFLTHDVHDWIATQVRFKKCFMFVAILWWIWMWRVHRVFKGIRSDIIDHVIRNAILLHDDMVKSSKELHYEKGKSSKKLRYDMLNFPNEYDDLYDTPMLLPRWSGPPAAAVYKLKVHGTYDRDSKRVGCGGVLRDHLGAWIVGFSANHVATASISAELMAIFHGLNFLWDKGYRNIICEMKNAKLVKLLQTGLIPPYFENFSLVLSIIGLLNRDWFITLSHVTRKDNGLTHYLAACGVRQPQSWVVWNTPPPSYAHL